MDDLVPDYPLPPEPNVSPNPSGLTRSRIAIALAFLVNGAGSASWISRIPVIKHELSLTDSQLGIVFFSAGAGALVGFPFSSYVCSRFGSRLATVAFGFAYCVTVAMVPFAKNLVALIFVLALLGLTQGAMDVSMNLNGAELERRFGRSIMSSLHAMFSLGGLLAAGMGTLLASRHVPIMWHLLGAAAFLTLVNAYSGVHMLRVPPVGRADHPIFAIPSRALLGIGIIVTCSFLAEGSVGDWSGVYLRDTLKTNHGFAVTGFTAYALMMTIGRFCGDVIIGRLGPVQVLRIFGSIAAAGFVAVILTSDPYIAVVGFACVGLGLSTIVPIGFSAAGRSGGMAPGAAIAAVATMGYAGFLLGPPVIGFLADYITLRWALAVVALLGVLVVGLSKSVEE